MSRKSSLKHVLLFLFAGFICLTVTAQDCDQYKALMKKADQALAEKNSELLAEVYHTDAVRHLSGAKFEGLEAIKKDAEEFYKNVPDAVGTNQEVLCSGDFLIVRWSGTGTPVGAPKPGKVTVSGITIYKIVDGKVKEEWEEISQLSMFMQMGFELKPVEATKD